MGVKERKEREKKEMKEMILQSAHRLFLEKGFEAASIRNIADSIEYSPALIYSYFKDKNEIFYAIQGEAFKAFNEYVSDVETIREPFDRLVHLSQKYIDFTFTHPQYYNIMFMMESPNNENAENWKEGEQTYTLFENILEACKKQGYFKNTDTKALSLSIWSYMHGMCSLTLRNRLRIYSQDEREAVRTRSFSIFIGFLQSL